MTDIDANSPGLQQVIQDHLRLVYSAALRQTRDAHLAEDVTQAVFILFLKKHRSISPEHVAGWLVKTAYFTSQEALRAKRRRQYHEKQAAMNTQTSSSQATNELADVLDGALSRLALRPRTAIALRYLEGKPVGEVAEKLGVSENAASKIILRATSKLRRFLSSHDPNLSLAPAVLTTALAEIAARNSSLDLSHIAVAISSHSISASTSSAALAHATGRLMLWAKIQTAAAICGTMLVVAGAGALAAHQAGWSAHAATPRPSRLQFRLVEKEGAASSQPFTVMDNPSPRQPRLKIDDEILLDESAIASAREMPDQQGAGYAIEVHFTNTGSKKISNITSQNIGHRLAIIFDGKLLSAPTIQSQLSTDAVITGRFTKSEADAIVLALGGHQTTPTTPATTSASLAIRNFDYTLGPMLEIPIASSSDSANPENTFISLEHHRALTPPEKLYWTPQTPMPFNPNMEQWVAENDINLLIQANGKNVRAFGTHSAYAPAADSPDKATTDSVNAGLNKIPWGPSRYFISVGRGKPFPAITNLPDNFYLRSGLQTTAIAQIAEDAKLPGHLVLRYRLMELDPTKPTGGQFIFQPSVLLYADPVPLDGRSGIQLVVDIGRPRQSQNLAGYYAGGLFLNGQLIATGRFNQVIGDTVAFVVGTFDMSLSQARAIASRINDATADNGYKRFKGLYALNPGQGVRFITPPFPPERQIFAQWPQTTLPGTEITFNINSSTVRGAFGVLLPELRQTGISLADAIYQGGDIKKYEFTIHPSLRSSVLHGDWVIDHAAPVATRLKTLQAIFSTQLGHPVVIEKVIKQCRVIVALGHYDFTPLPQVPHADTLALASSPADVANPAPWPGTPEGTWQQMLDYVSDIIGVRIISFVENPPPDVRWTNYATLWKIRNFTAETTDQKLLEGLLQNLSAQTNLDFKIETRDEPIYIIRPGP